MHFCFLPLCLHSIIERVDTMDRPKLGRWELYKAAQEQVVNWLTQTAGDVVRGKTTLRAQQLLDLARAVADSATAVPHAILALLQDVSLPAIITNEQILRRILVLTIHRRSSMVASPRQIGTVDDQIAKTTSLINGSLDYSSKSAILCCLRERWPAARSKIRRYGHEVCERTSG